MGVYRIPTMENIFLPQIRSSRYLSLFETTLKKSPIFIEKSVFIRLAGLVVSDWWLYKTNRLSICYYFYLLPYLLSMSAENMTTL